VGHPLKRGGFSRCTYNQPYAFRAAFCKWSAMRDASKKLPWATAHRELGPRGRAADQAAWQPLLAQVPREPGATAGEPQPRSHSRGTAWLAWGAAWGRRVSNRIAVPPVHDMCMTVGSSSVNHRHAAAPRRCVLVVPTCATKSGTGGGVGGRAGCRGSGSGAGSDVAGACGISFRTAARGEASPKLPMPPSFRLS
jgi:hypothetical protein